jgi:hypothetical protein
MKDKLIGLLLRSFVVLCIAATIAAGRSCASPPKSARCQRVVLTGEVSAGQEWRAPFGHGWVFRIVPIQPGKAGFSGWDLVVDREQPAGFPDALLLATPPYNSINEHEVGTTFGLRAQDAIGWNPRSFHFLADPDALRESQRLFQLLGGTKQGDRAPASGNQEQRSIARQLEINQRALPGEFLIVDARLVPGIADAAPYAENWALASSRTPHSIEAGAQGRSTPLGELHWIRFSITLWLPDTWALSKQLHAQRTACGE